MKSIELCGNFGNEKTLERKGKKKGKEGMKKTRVVPI